jgi:hypothetical protein
MSSETRNENAVPGNPTITSHGSLPTLYSRRMAAKEASIASQAHPTADSPASPPPQQPETEMMDATASSASPIENPESALYRTNENSPTAPSGAFIRPKTRKRVATSPPTLPTILPLKTRNRFSPIQPEDENNDAAPLIQAPEERQEPPRQRPPARRRPPPILIYSISDYKKSIALIKSVVKGEFTLDIRKAFTRLQVDTAEDHAAATALLQKEKAETSSWAPTEERTTSFLVRGIEADFDLDYLKELFEGEGIAVAGIRTILDRNRQKKDLHQLTVRTSPEWTAKKIGALKKVGSVHLRLTPFKHDRPQMCFNCNRFGHSSTHCTAAPRCWKCAGDHYGARCTLPREQPATCCNCRGDHPAMSRKCAVYRMHLERLRTQQGPTKATATKTAAPPASSSNLGRQNPWGTGLPAPSNRPRETPHPRLDVDFPSLPPTKATKPDSSALPAPEESAADDLHAILRQLLVISLQTQQQLQQQTSILTKMFATMAAQRVP